MINQSLLLAAQAPTEDRIKTQGQGGLENQQFIGINNPLHHVFAQAIGGTEQHRVPEAAFGVEAEHHPGAGPIGQNHPLHANREGHSQVAEAVVLPVGEGAIGEQGGIATAGGRQQLGFALDMQKGVLLAGKTGLRQILCGGTGAHGHGGRLFAGPHQAAIGRQQRRFQLRR